METEPLVRTKEELNPSYESLINNFIHDEIVDDSDTGEQDHEGHDRPPHRFHYTFDDRTIDECTHYFDLTDFSLSNGKGLDVEELSIYRRKRSHDEEESIYFEAFVNEILPRE